LILHSARVFHLWFFVAESNTPAYPIRPGGGYKKGNAMKKAAVFYTVTLGILWEVVYVMVIIGAGVIFSLAFRYIR